MLIIAETDRRISAKLPAAGNGKKKLRKEISTNLSVYRRIMKRTAEDGWKASRRAEEVTTGMMERMIKSGRMTSQAHAAKERCDQRCTQP